MSQPTVPQTRVAAADYLAAEVVASTKHELFDGRIVAMAGASVRHTRISGNILFTTKSGLRGGTCDAFGSDLRVYVKSIDSVFYPDVTVICGQVISDPSLPAGQTATNPTLIFEVLSPSTERIDRTRKFSAYMRLRSLREYVLVHADQPRVESFLRQDDGTWSFSFAEGGDAVLNIRSIGLTLSLAEVYANVDFDEPSGV